MVVVVVVVVATRKKFVFVVFFGVLEAQGGEYFFLTIISFSFVFDEAWCFGRRVYESEVLGGLLLQGKELGIPITSFSFVEDFWILFSLHLFPASQVYVWVYSSPCYFCGSFCCWTWMFPSLVFCVFVIFQVLSGLWGFLGGFSLGVGFGEKSIHSGLSVRVSHSFVCFLLFHAVAWVFFDESFEFEPPCFLSCCQTFQGFEICMEHMHSRRKELCFFKAKLWIIDLSLWFWGFWTLQDG